MFLAERNIKFDIRLDIKFDIKLDIKFVLDRGVSGGPHTFVWSSFQPRLPTYCHDGLLGI